MNIGIDIDDTIAKTSEETDIWAKYYTEKILKRTFKIGEIESTDPMWARHLYKWSIEEDKKFWDLYYEKIMENVDIKNNAKEVINYLNKYHNIIIITARWEKSNGIIEKITKQWLESKKINYDKFFMGYKDKRGIVKENNINIFIDDSIKTCEEISELNVRTMLMNSRINKNFKTDRIERVFSWDEIKKKIQLGGE